MIHVALYVSERPLKQFGSLFEANAVLLLIDTRFVGVPKESHALRPILVAAVGNCQFVWVWGLVPSAGVYGYRLCAMFGALAHGRPSFCHLCATDGSN